MDGFTSLLGKPAIRLPGVAIYRGDCVEALSELRESCADLVVTSPPYNIGKEYESKCSVEGYAAWCALWLRGIRRVVAPQGAFWLNLGYFEVPGRGRAIPIPYVIWNLVPFYLMQEVVWNYGAGVASRRSFSPRNEKFLWYVSDPSEYVFNLDAVRDTNVKYPNQRKNGRLRCNPLGKNPSDVWQFSKVTSGADRSSPERTAHPAQFPVAVIERIVRACSNVGDLILDPFMGSGTVAEVAMRLGRAVVGIEIDARYVELARGRLRRAREVLIAEQAQGRLFSLE
ncbi:MAG: site-specific DNA-methyltransferase [Planctomycetes bacterium]|nr:site-specific DNA-methyltransferase [Planctomycetota bacterium]